MRASSLVCRLVIIIGCWEAARTSGQELPDYPRVNLSTLYEVDPAWPQRPAGVEWGAVPGIAVDGEGRVWVFTRGQPPVQVYDAAGKYLRGWGSAEIQSAHHLEIDPQGHIWVADVELHVVMQFNPGGQLLRTLGTRGEKGEDPSHFNKPTDMAITPAGDVFVSDGYANSRVVHFDPAGRFVRAWGTLGTEPGQFSVPHAIAVDSQGRLYVADRNNARVQVFDPTGKLLDVWSDVVTPWGFWITAEDQIWICGSTPTGWQFSGPEEPLGCPPRDQAFFRFDTSGRLKQIWTVPKGIDGNERPGDLNWVHCLAVDPQGNIYAGDILGQRAQKFLRVAPGPVAR